MDHLVILPIVLPLVAATLMLLPPLSGKRLAASGQRVLSLATLVLLLPVLWVLLNQSAEGEILVYNLGDWPAPYGIVLILDRLAALMLSLTLVLALGALIYACAGDDRLGVHFHPLFLFQLAGINAAFLTGDLFNLFVAFEILLIASYALLIHGDDRARTGAAIHYVTLNLVGSALFLIALGTLYGTLGTLNMADMAARIPELNPGDQKLVRAGGMLLLVVFGLKAAMLPLHAWLPRTYASASTPVAALFAILTKVGVYCLLRVFGLLFGDQAGDLAGLVLPWLQVLGIATLAAAVLGLLSAVSLRELTGYLILISVGTLLVALAVGSSRATSAALYYLVHSTLVSGALFLLAGLIAEGRGKAQDRLVGARRIAKSPLLGAGFLVAAMSVTGLPPFSGFVGKVLVLAAPAEPSTMLWLWPPILLASLACLLMLSRTGSILFWRTSGPPRDPEPLGLARPLGLGLLLAGSPVLVIFGGPVVEFTQATAEQLAALSQDPRMLLPEGRP